MRMPHKRKVPLTLTSECSALVLVDITGNHVDGTHLEAQRSHIQHYLVVGPLTPLTRVALILLARMPTKAHRR